MRQPNLRSRTAFAAAAPWLLVACQVAAPPPEAPTQPGPAGATEPSASVVPTAQPLRTTAPAASTPPYWIHRFPELGGWEDNFLVALSDGGLLLSPSPGALLKLDREGRVVWGRELLGIDPKAAFQTPNGNLIVFGAFKIVELNRHGTLLSWTEYSYPPGDPLLPAPVFFEIENLRVRSDSTAVAVGTRGEVLTVDQHGQLIDYQLQRGPSGVGWVTTVGPQAVWNGGSSVDPVQANWVERRGVDGLSWRVRLEPPEGASVATRPHFLIETADGGALFGSDQQDHLDDQAPKLWLVRLDQTGQVLWQRVYAVGPGKVSVHETRDGSFVLAGWGRPRSGRTPGALDSYLWIARIESSGDLRWARLFGGEAMLPLINVIQEAPDGSLFLSGDLGAFDGQQVVRGHDLVVMKISAAGELPGCDLMYEATSGPTRIPKSKVVALGAESIQLTEPAVQAEDFLADQQVLTYEVQQIQGCVAARPAPIPEPAPGGQARWIVGASGVLFGSYFEGDWRSGGSAEVVPPPGTSFHLYFPDGRYIGETQSTGGEIAQQSGCSRIELARDLTGIRAFGISGAWQLQPQRPLELDLRNELYLSYVGEVLEQRGLPGADHFLTELLRVDFEQDGTDEVLLSARYYEREPATGDLKGRSLVLLRRVVGNQVQTHLLLPEPGQPDATRENFEIIGLYDLNGDGDLEIVIEGEIDGARATWLFEVGSDGPVSALSLGCRMED